MTTTTGMLKEDETTGTHECIYCGTAGHNLGAPIPSAKDDAAWADIAGGHRADCEWVLTRAHRIG